MEKVCLLCSVSTQAQDYEYQISTLTELCKTKSWGSGAKEYVFMHSRCS